jgi:ATP-dependent helicase YprA (DUF1998 family)
LVADSAQFKPPLESFLELRAPSHPHLLLFSLILLSGAFHGIRAIIVYPMNALAKGLEEALGFLLIVEE